jgi:hypothetical protein
MRVRAADAPTLLCASQGSRLQLLARVVDESAPAAAAPQPPHALPQPCRIIDSQESSARGTGYSQAADARQATASSEVRVFSARVRAALDGLPREARAVFERTLWFGAELLLRAPTADVLYTFGARRATLCTA